MSESVAPANATAYERALFYEVLRLTSERDDLDHQLAQHVIALRDMRNERDTYKRALRGKP